MRHALTGEPIPTAEAQFAFTSAVLDRATPETIAYRFVQRLAEAAPHVLVVVPESEAGDVPSVAAFVAQAIVDARTGHSSPVPTTQESMAS